MGLPPSGGVVDGRTGDPSDRSLPAPTPRDQITTPPHNLYRSLAVPDAEKVLQFLFNVNEHTLFVWIKFCNTVARLVLISISKKMHWFLQKTFPAVVNTSSTYLDDIKRSGGFGRDCAFPCLVQSWLCRQDGGCSSTKSQRPKSSQRCATLPTTCSHIWHRTRRKSSSYRVCLVKTWKSEERKPKLLLYQHRCRLLIIASISSKQTWSGLPAN